MLKFEFIQLLQIQIILTFLCFHQRISHKPSHETVSTNHQELSSVDEPSMLLFQSNTGVGKGNKLTALSSPLSVPASAFTLY